MGFQRLNAVAVLVLLVCSILPSTSVSAASLLVRDGAGSVLARFDDQALAALPQRTITTTTPWTEGVSTFTGPTLASIVAATGEMPDAMILRALNDYEVEFPMASMTPTEPIIARLRDGEAMTIRDKGPLWVMFPFDDDPELQQERFYSLSVWQLTELIRYR